MPEQPPDSPLETLPAPLPAHPERITMRGNVAAMPSAAWVLFAGTFVNRFGSFVLPFLILYLRSRGYSIPAAGGAVAAYGAGGLVASAVGGHAADRLGRRNALAASMFGSAATMLVLSQVSGYGPIVAVAALAGLASEAYRPASMALVADLVPPRARVTGYALYRLAVNVGFAAGPVVAGILAEHSFTLLFVGDAATSVVFGVLALVALPQGVTSARAEERLGGGGYRSLLGDRALLVFLGATLGYAFVYLQSHSTFALAVQAAGLSTVDYGLLLAINGLLIIVVELPISSVTQRLPPRPVIAVGLLLEALGFGATGFATTFVALAVTVVVWTLGETISSPVGQAYLAELAPRHLRGRYSGAAGLMWGAAGVLSPSTGAALFALAAHGTVLWLVCLGVDVAAAALILVAGGGRRRR